MRADLSSMLEAAAQASASATVRVLATLVMLVLVIMITTSSFKFVPGVAFVCSVGQWQFCLSFSHWS